MSIAQADENEELRFLCFNIRLGVANDGANHWDKRKELVFDVLRDHSADVCGLQEAWKFQIDAIREAVPGYALIGRSRQIDAEEGEWCPILYREDKFAVLESGTFWLSDTPEEVGSMSWGNQIPRICTWARLEDKDTGRRVAVFNTHFDHKSLPSKTRSAGLCLEKIVALSAGDPVVFMGDLNSGENSEAVQQLSANLVDTFRVTYPDRIGDVGTFGRWVGQTDGNRIDYIFTSPKGLAVSEAEILHDQSDDGRYPSDHYPVFAVLEFVEQRTTKAIVLGIDGLAPFAVTAQTMPFLHSIGETGVLDLEATNCWTEGDPFNGQSAPNWATILTGQSPTVHAVARNGDRIHKISDTREGSVRSIFWLLKEIDPSIETGLVNTWGGIAPADGTLLSDCMGSIDHHFRAEEPADDPTARDGINHEKVCELISKTDIDFLFVHLDGMDSRGHKFGWKSQEYRDAGTLVDQRIAEVQKQINARPNRANEDWLLIVTSDHGGFEKNHKDTTNPLVRTIPIAVWGEVEGVPEALTNYDIVPLVQRHFE